MDNYGQTDFCKSIASKFSDIAQILEEHTADNDELLPHVFMGDVTRYMLSNGTQRRDLAQYLEDSFADSGVGELIAVSFVENLESQDELDRALEGIEGSRLRSEWKKQHSC